jgi:hypothetical protein
MNRWISLLVTPFQPSRAMALPVKKSNDSFYIFKYNDAPAIKKEELNNMVFTGNAIALLG